MKNIQIVCISNVQRNSTSSSIRTISRYITVMLGVKPLAILTCRMCRRYVTRYESLATFSALTFIYIYYKWGSDVRINNAHNSISSTFLSFQPGNVKGNALRYYTTKFITDTTLKKGDSINDVPLPTDVDVKRSGFRHADVNSKNIVVQHF
jgi:hypothetical protein